MRNATVVGASAQHLTPPDTGNWGRLVSPDEFRIVQAEAAVWRLRLDEGVDREDRRRAWLGAWLLWTPIGATGWKAQAEREAQAAWAVWSEGCWLE
jgi:hypothetical protein